MLHTKPLLGRHAIAHAGSSSFAFSACGDKFSYFTEAIGRHTAVYGFVVAGFHDVSFVPDANIATAAADAAVEINPCRPVLLVFGSRIGFQMLEGAPVLDDHAPDAAVPKNPDSG